MLRALLITFMLLIGFKAQALEIVTDCSDLPMLQKAWEERYFRDFFKTSKVAPPKLSCNGKDQNKPYILAKTFWFIENAKTDVAGYYYQQAKKYVRTIVSSPEFTNEEDSCAGADEKYIGQINLYGCFFYEFDGEKDERGEYIKKPYTNDQMKQIVYSAATIIHEIRHVEMGSAARHIKCNGTECDRNYSEDPQKALPYAYEIIYLKDILRNNQFSPEIERAIKSNIRVTRENHFPPTISSNSRSSRSSK